jgi:F-type H+-transporting ATPase subunit b
VIPLAEGAPQGINLFLPPWGEVILSVVSLLLIGGIVWKLVVPKFLATLDERHDQIEGSIERATQAEETAKVVQKQAEEQVTEQLADAGRAREAATEEASAILAKAREDANAERQHILDQARVEIEAERREAEARLQKQVGDLAIQLAERIVGESLTDSKLAGRVVDRFIAELETSEATDGQKASSAAGAEA